MCFGKCGARNGECVESREPMTPNDAAQETHLNGAEKAREPPLVSFRRPLIARLHILMIFGYGFD